ncbi:hypothetical protein ES703_95267 [subsurface metagenome]
MAEQTVTLNPGESKVVAFEVTPSEARTYQVSVNGLAGSFIATEAPPEVTLIPCPLCPFIPSTREDLIAHMETNHSGIPYLISGYPEKEEVSPPEKAIFYFELFIPYTHPPTCRGYPFDYWYFRAKIVSPLDYSDERYITHNGYYPWRSSGFHEANLVLPTDYEYHGYQLLPPGTYSVVAKCGFCGTLGIYTRCGEECVVWRDLDTGLDIKVI